MSSGERERQGSSVVEQGTHKPWVGSSILPPATLFSLLSGGRFFGDVEGGDAEGEGACLAGGETVVGDEFFHGGAGGEAFDGAAQVFVGLPLAGDPAGDAWHDAFEVEEVELADTGEGGDGEVEDEEMATGAEDAGHFVQGDRPGGHVSEAEGDGEGVEGGVGEGEVHAVGGDEGKEVSALGLAHHGDGKVSTDDGGVGAMRLNGLHEVATAGGEVEKICGMVFSDQACGVSTPEDVNAKAEDVIGEDVSACDSCEGLSDKSGVLHG